MKIQDVYDLNVFIDELNVFEAPGVVFVRGEIFESIANPIPTCELELNIPLDWFDYRSIVDGTIIKFKLKSKAFNLNNEYVFRLFNVRKLNIEQKYVHLILEGIIDFYSGYETGNAFNAYCSSSEIFSAVAKKYNLINDIDSTNDAQLWIAGENNTYQFLNYIAKYGWINETSAMIWCIDRDKRLLYKNLTTLFRNRRENIFKFIQTPNARLQNKEFSYTNATASIQAGLENLKENGYGGSDLYFDLNTYSYKKANARKVVAESNLINISKELSKGLANTWYPFEIGNQHSNYYNAFKQNNRILSTYSSYITLQSQFFQPYRLCQIVNFEYLDAQDIKNEVVALSGIYMISAVHISLTLKAITSTIELSMQGLNGKATTRETY